MSLPGENGDYKNDGGKVYDTAIIGGGLAGLALSILLCRKGYQVVLFEKEVYPFHKVCGEYISMESWDFLLSLGLPLEQWNLPRINRVKISSPKGSSLNVLLPLGGFGVSRYKLDAALATIAREEGVTLYEGTRINESVFDGNQFSLVAATGAWSSRTCTAAFGKRANLDLKWKRDFTDHLKKGHDNYVGVKYHVRCNLPEDLIQLHNFPGGYCGISRIEDNRFCLCYMTHAVNLKNSHHSIPELEEQILKKNPRLKGIFQHAEFLFQQPVTIAQISFAKKTQVEHHLLCVGDAAGMITPLCGNGMSMALHASRLAFSSLDDFLSGRVEREQMEKEYTRTWNRTFEKRLATGRWLQRLFGKPVFSDAFIRALRPFPRLVRALIRRTHGKSI